MPMYSVKIGEIHLTAERPLTSEDRKQAKEWLESGRVPIIMVEAADGVEMYAELTVDRH